MDNIISVIVVILFLSNVVLIYYINNLNRRNRTLNKESKFYRDSLLKITNLFYNLLCVKNFDQKHNAKLIIEFFTTSDLIKYKWSETAFSNQEFFEGDHEDYPKRDLDTPEKMAEWIEKFSENEKNLGWHRVHFFLKNIWRKMREFNPQLEIKIENYKTFRDNYISLIKRSR